MKKINVLQNKLLVKLLFITIISILLGIFYIAIISKSNKELVEDNLKLFIKSLDKLPILNVFFKCFFSNSFYIILIWLLGISIIGIPFIILLLVIKSFILGFSISSILYFYKFKGILMAIIYVIPLVINLLIIIFLGYYAIIFSKNLNRLLFLKKDISFKNIMRRYFRILAISLIGIIISSFIESCVIPSVLKLLQI